MRCFQYSTFVSLMPARLVYEMALPNVTDEPGNAPETNQVITQTQENIAKAHEEMKSVEERIQYVEEAVKERIRSGEAADFLSSNYNEKEFAEEAAAARKGEAHFNDFISHWLRDIPGVTQNSELLLGFERALISLAKEKGLKITREETPDAFVEPKDVKLFVELAGDVLKKPADESTDAGLADQTVEQIERLDMTEQQVFNEVLSLPADEMKKFVEDNEGIAKSNPSKASQNLVDLINTHREQKIAANETSDYVMKFQRGALNDLGIQNPKNKELTPDGLLGKTSLYLLAEAYHGRNTTVLTDFVSGVVKGPTMEIADARIRNRNARYEKAVEHNTALLNGLFEDFTDQEIVAYAEGEANAVLDARLASIPSTYINQYLERRFGKPGMTIASRNQPTSSDAEKFAYADPKSTPAYAKGFRSVENTGGEGILAQTEGSIQSESTLTGVEMAEKIIVNNAAKAAEAVGVTPSPSADDLAARMGEAIAEGRPLDEINPENPDDMTASARERRKDFENNPEALAAFDKAYHEGSQNDKPTEEILSSNPVALEAYYAAINARNADKNADQVAVNNAEVEKPGE